MPIWHLDSHAYSLSHIELQVEITGGMTVQEAQTHEVDELRPAYEEGKAVLVKATFFDAYTADEIIVFINQLFYERHLLLDIGQQH